MNGNGGDAVKGAVESVRGLIPEIPGASASKGLAEREIIGGND